MREYLDVKLEVKEVSETGAFFGYGSVFGVEDHYAEVVTKGAFIDSLAKKTPAMLWQHRASEPIGVWLKAEEDDNGLMLEGQLALKVRQGAEAYELLKMNAINGMSIGFNTVEENFDQKSGIRYLNRVDLWEVSLVTFPANESARVTTVKQIEDIVSYKDAECFLRDLGGMSRSEAVNIVSKIKAIAHSDYEAVAEIKRIAEMYATKLR